MSARSFRIVSGQPRLTQAQSRNELDRRAAPARAPEKPATLLERGDGYVCEFDPNDPVPLRRGMSHHCVDGWHLWIGVEDGILLVLDEKQNSLFAGLGDGAPPAQLLAKEARPDDLPAEPDGIGGRWRRIVDLIQKVTEAGFVEGVRGYHEIRSCQPEKFARLHITRRCQLTCLHCYADSSPRVDRRTELPRGEWIAIVDDIARHGGQSVLFTGGEPLLRRDCPALMRRAKEAGLRVTLFSNGLLVKARLAEFAPWADFVQLSLNGPDEESNDAIRGRGTFRRVVEALDLLLGKGVPTQLGITVMERNWRAIKTGFLPFARRFEGSSLRFHLGYGLCHHGRAASLEDQFDLEEARPVLDEFLAIVNGEEGRRITRKTTNCGYCEQLVIGPDGTVYPCHLLEGPLGHLRDRSLADWHELLRKVSSAHDVSHVKGCSRCDLRNLCGGTCRVVNEQTTGKKLVTTCSRADREAKYRNLVRLFAERPATRLKTD